MEIQIKAITAFDNHQIEKREPGAVTVSTQVSQSALNIYGHGHGGYLFTLADEIAGWTAISTGVTVVTLQSSINYTRPAQEHDRLTISGTCQHQGKSTLLVQVTITNQEEKTIAQANFTMFVTGRIDN